MALPTPWKTRQEISIVEEFAIPEKRDESVVMTMPQMKIFFLPYISAILPKGTRKAAEDSRYAVATQAKVTAPNDSSLPIAGRAILTEEPMKGKRKDVIVATRSTRLLPVPLPTGSSTIR